MAGGRRPKRGGGSNASTTRRAAAVPASVPELTNAAEVLDEEAIIETPVKTMGQTPRSATSTRTEGAGAVSWVNTFPAVVDTEPNSTAFVRRAAYVILGQYVKLRDLVPADSFKRRRLEELKFYTFDKDKAPKLVDLAQSALKTIDLGFLRELLVVVSESDAPDAPTLETLTLRFAYDKGASMTVATGTGHIFKVKYEGEEAVKAETRAIIIRLTTLTQALAAIPKGAIAELRMSYMPHTPKDFEPSGFTSCKQLTNFSDPDTIEVRLGSAHAKFHALESYLKSVFVSDALSMETLMSGATSATANKIMDTTAITSYTVTPAKDDPKTPKVSKTITELVAETDKKTNLSGSQYSQRGAKKAGQATKQALESGAVENSTPSGHRNDIGNLITQKRRSSSRESLMDSVQPVKVARYAAHHLETTVPLSVNSDSSMGSG